MNVLDIADEAIHHLE